MTLRLAHPASPVLLLLLCLALALGAKAKETSKTVNIKGLKYDPKELKIKAGEKVTWVNKDDNDHTVTADDGSFKSDNLGSGEKFEFTFKKPGRYKYHCKYHPRMVAIIIVE